MAILVYRNCIKTLKTTKRLNKKRRLTENNVQKDVWSKNNTIKRSRVLYSYQIL